MKKFIVLLIMLFIGVFISTNYSNKEELKNDITVLAPCTDNNVVLSTDLLSADYSYIVNGSSIHYYLSNCTNISNNHSIVTNSIKLKFNFIYSNFNNTINFLYESVHNPKAKTIGLQGIINKIHFNVYLYHSNNKLGQT